MPDLGNMTATAILGWYAWHTASKTIPGLVRAFRDEMAASRSEARAERDALASEREQCHADHQEMVAVVQQLIERLPSDL
jgi:hypothetical protein